MFAFSKHQFPEFNSCFHLVLLSIVSCSNEASSPKVSVHLAHAKFLAIDVRLVLGVVLNIAHPRAVAGHNVVVRVVLVPVGASAVPPSLGKETRSGRWK